MSDKSDIGIVDCHVSTSWDPDCALDDTSFDYDAVDSAMLAIRCHEAR